MEAQLLAVQQTLIYVQSQMAVFQSQVTTLRAENSDLRATVGSVSIDNANLNAHMVTLQSKLDAALTTTTANKTIGKVTY